MASSHHGSPEGAPKKFTEEQMEIMERFMAQARGMAQRQYSAGRISPDDDGDLAMAICADKAHQTVIIRFGKPVEWIGLGAEETKALIQNLLGKLREISSEPFTLEV